MRRNSFITGIVQKRKFHGGNGMKFGHSEACWEDSTHPENSMSKCLVVEVSGVNSRAAAPALVKPRKRRHKVGWFIVEKIMQVF